MLEYFPEVYRETLCPSGVLFTGIPRCLITGAKKGYIAHCLEGEFISELKTGEKIKLAKGETYVVSDEMRTHRSISADGVKLLIIDGDFLKNTKSI